LVTRFSGTEALGRLFEYDLALVSEDTKVDFTAIVAQPVTLVIAADGNGSEKIVNGYVSRFTQTDKVGAYMQYHATIVPYVWFLTRASNCQIVPKPDTVPKMVKQFLSGRGFDDVEDNLLVGNYSPREYCVQYGETDFNFISRLLEEEGISYHLEHRRNGADFKHVMVLTDSPPAKSIADANVLRSAPVLSEEPGAVIDWVAMTGVEANRATLIDFDFKTCNVLLSNNSADIQVKAPSPLGEMVSHPGDFATSGEGDALVSIRAQELASSGSLYHAVTAAHQIAAGLAFTLEGNDRGDQNGRYLAISSSHTGSANIGQSGETDSGDIYICSFAAIPLETPYRPARSAPKPIIAGPQTAIVVGDQNKNVVTDEFGRVQVTFHWDTNPSCFVRVAQIWAGSRWGGMFMPRAGQEVVVEFLEGNPDRPLITGRVYNGVAKPPYDPQQHATVSTIKSASAGDSSSNGYNELRFEDKAGSENVFLHAQKRMDVLVKGSLHETVGGSHEELIGHDDKGDFNRTIANDINAHQKGGRFELVEKKLNHNVKLEVVQVFEDARTIAVTNRQTLNAKEIAIEAKQALSLKGDGVVVQGAEGVSLKAGNIKIEGRRASVSSAAAAMWCSRRAASSSTEAWCS